MFTGSMPALVTPFKDGAVDFDALKKLVDWHVDQGSNGLVPVGTTGESPTLTPRRTPRRGRGGGEGRRRPSAGDRRRGVQQHRRGDRADPARRTRGRAGGAGRHALLQQADPARPDRAFHRAARCLQAADHHLQHPGPFGDRHDARNDGRTGQAAADHRASRTPPARSSASSSNAPPAGRISSSFRARMPRPSASTRMAGLAASR